MGGVSGEWCQEAMGGCPTPSKWNEWGGDAGDFVSRYERLLVEAMYRGVSLAAVGALAAAKDA